MTEPTHWDNRQPHRQAVLDSHLNLGTVGGARESQSRTEHANWPLGGPTRDLPALRDTSAPPCCLQQADPHLNVVTTSECNRSSSSCSNVMTIRLCEGQNNKSISIFTQQSDHWRLLTHTHTHTRPLLRHTLLSSKVWTVGGERTTHTYRQTHT